MYTCHMAWLMRGGRFLCVDLRDVPVQFPAPRPPAKGYLRFLPPADRRQAEHGLAGAPHGEQGRLKDE